MSDLQQQRDQIRTNLVGWIDDGFDNERSMRAMIGELIDAVLNLAETIEAVNAPPVDTTS